MVRDGDWCSTRCRAPPRKRFVVFKCRCGRSAGRDPRSMSDESRVGDGLGAPFTYFPVIATVAQWLRYGNVQSRRNLPFGSMRTAADSSQS